MNINVQEVSFIGANPPLVAYVKLLLDGWLCIRSIKVVRKQSGELFVSMPNAVGKDGEWHDIAFPIHKQGRELLERKILGAVSDALELRGESLDADERHAQSS